MQCFKWNGKVPVAAMALGMLSPVGAAPSGGPQWSLVDPCSVEPELMASRCGERVLAWDNGKMLAGSVYLKVNVPFPQARALVAKALAQSGKVEETDGRVEWNELPEDWLNAVFLARPDLRQKWAERKIRPEIEEGIRCGAFPATDLAWRLRNAATFSHPGPKDLELVLPAASGSSIDQRPVKYGATRRKSSWFASDRSDLEVLAFDATLLFGHPTTAIVLKRTDELPNPRYRSPLRSFLDFWGDLFNGRNPLGEWNVLAGSPSKTNLENVVPAQEFEALRLAFEGQKTAVEVESWAEHWFAVPAKAATTIPEDVASIDAVATLFKSFGNLPDGIQFPANLMALSNGDLAISGQSHTEPDSSSYGIWRLRADGAVWNAQAIWKGAASGLRLEATPDGTAFWFDGTSGSDEKIRRLYRYGIKPGQLEAWALKEDEELSEWLNSWRLDADQVPYGFHRSYETDALLHATHLNQQAGESTGKRTGWLASPRAKYVKEADAVGLRRSSSQGLWLVDDAVSKIDPATGRTLVSWPVPFGSRLGNRPTVLEFPSSQSVALGFRTGSDQFGMHLLDLETGEVKATAMSQDGKPVCAARSGGGRWLAMGGERHGAGAWAKLYDARTGKLAAILDASSQVRREIHALAFSWDGRTLWGIGDDALLRWDLPDSLSDLANPGEFPDQVRAGN